MVLSFLLLRAAVVSKNESNSLSMLVFCFRLVGFLVFSSSDTFSFLTVVRLCECDESDESSELSEVLLASDNFSLLIWSGRKTRSSSLESDSLSLLLLLLLFDDRFSCLTRSVETLSSSSVSLESESLESSVFPLRFFAFLYFVSSSESESFSSFIFIYLERKKKIMKNTEKLRKYAKMTDY